MFSDESIHRVCFISICTFAQFYVNFCLKLIQILLLFNFYINSFQSIQRKSQNTLLLSKIYKWTNVKITMFIDWVVYLQLVEKFAAELKCTCKLNLKLKIKTKAKSTRMATERISRCSTWNEIGLWDKWNNGLYSRL